MKTLLVALLALGVAVSATAGDRRSGDSDRRRDRDGGRRDHRSQSHDRRPDHRGHDGRHGHWRPGRSWDAWTIGLGWGWSSPGWSVGYSHHPGWCGRTGWIDNGWGWDNGWSETVYVDSAPAWGAPAPAGTTNYAGNGALLGGIAGAIIGHQDGHTGRGALIGTGAGLLLGAIADSAQRQPDPAPVVESRPRVVCYPAVEPEASGPVAPSQEATPPPAKPAQPKAKSTTRMAEANALFGR